MLHSIGVAANSPLGIGISVNDAILPVVPMFHANAWGYPYVATMTGSKLVYPGPHLDPESLLDLMADEKVAWAAGVPTIWMGILQLLDANPGTLGSLVHEGDARRRLRGAARDDRRVSSSGTALSIVQGWGMTETSPVASTATLPHDLAERRRGDALRHRGLAGMPLPFVEIRARVGDEEIPWDGEAMGELEVRGPWVAAGYFDTPEQADRWTGRRLVPDRRHRRPSIRAATSRSRTARRT